MTIAELKAERDRLKRRLQWVNVNCGSREKLTAELAAIEAKIAQASRAS